MTLRPAQLDSLLRHLQLFLASARWAPEESWDEEERPVVFVNECQCYSAIDREPASLTLFLRGDLLDAHFNIHQRLVNATRSWAKSNLMWIACPACKHELRIEVYLFDQKRQTFPPTPSATFFEAT